MKVTLSVQSYVRLKHQKTIANINIIKKIIEWGPKMTKTKIWDPESNLNLWEKSELKVLLKNK